MMETPEEQDRDGQEASPKRSGFLATVFNVVSAAFGVRSSKLRDQDFTQNKFHYFVITAIAFVIIFIATVFSVVKLVLSQAG